jgi:hypothetical protein
MNAQLSLSGLDSAFLSLETPSTPMHVMGTFVLDASDSGSYSFERILRLLEERVPDLAPLRSRLAAMPFGVDQPVWIDDPDLRIRTHVHRMAAPAPGSDQVLADLVARIASQPLDRTRPLWELSVIEGLAEERVALVFKVHHAVADGVSAMRLPRAGRCWPTRSRGCPGAPRASRGSCVADAKLVASVFGTTLNDVVLAACTHSLRDYLEAHGGVPDVPLVAAIPMSLRDAADPETYGNRISAFLVHLPVHLADPVEQLLAVSRDARSSKQLHAELGASAIGEWAEFGSAALREGAARFYSDHGLAGRHAPLHNLVISNVRGPAVPLYAAGARLTAAYPLGPLMEGAGINITVLSYLGAVDFGVIACERSVPHVADIALGFGAAVADLFKIALEQNGESQP